MSCVSTIKVYQHLSVNDDPDVHIIKDGSLKTKDKRRQLASTSIHNLASQIGAIAYANLRIVLGKWDHPKALPKDLKLALQIMSNITGSNFKPISPVYLLNEDYSSQYYFSGLSR